MSGFFTFSVPTDQEANIMLTQPTRDKANRLKGSWFPGDARQPPPDLHISIGDACYPSIGILRLHWYCATKSESYLLVFII